ncbi:unnamed protein product [Closterium sp. NIES-54]
MLLAPEEDPDAPDIPTPRSYAEAITGPYSSQWQVAMDAEMASWKSTGTYVDEVPPPGANIVDGMWIFKGSLHEEIRLRRPPGCTGTFPAGTQWSLCRLVYGLRQVPREWHDTLRTTLAALGFAPSTADPSLFLRTNTSLPPFYVQVYVHNLVVATPDTEALTLVKSELQKRHTCTDLGKLRSYLGLQITRDRAQRTMTLTQSHMVHQVLQRFGFQISSPQLTPVSTSHSLSAPPSYESVEPSAAATAPASASTAPPTAATASAAAAPAPVTAATALLVQLQPLLLLLQPLMLLLLSAAAAAERATAPSLPAAPPELLLLCAAAAVTCAAPRAAAATAAASGPAAAPELLPLPTLSRTLLRAAAAVTSAAATAACAAAAAKRCCCC